MGSLLVAGIAAGQGEGPLKPEQDLELWLSGAVEFRPFGNDSRKAETPFMKKFRCASELGYRTNENLGQGKSVYAILGARYRFTKWLRVGAEGRYNIRDRYSPNSFRADVGAVLSTEAGQFDLDYRVNYQHEFIPPWRIPTFLRNRFTLGYRIKDYPIDPFFSVESFTALSYQGNFHAGMRYDLGAKVNLKGDHSLDVVFRHDREIGFPTPLYRWIIVLAYEFRYN